jgi:tetratricopeptide (TPR) repeat protein
MEEKKEDTLKNNLDIERYTGILNKDPKARVYAPLAEAYRKSGMFDKAIEVSKNGLSLYPDYLSCRVTLGRAYYDKGMYKEAKEELLKVVEVIPDNIMAQKLLGKIYSMEGDIDKAIKSYEMVTFQVPGDKEIIEEIEALRREMGASVGQINNEIGLKVEEVEFDKERELEPEKEISIKRAEEPVMKGEKGTEKIHDSGKENIEAAFTKKKDINTETLAELYIKQGYFKRAFNIYKELYLSDPQNKAIKKKLIELKGMIVEKIKKQKDSNKPDKSVNNINLLENWLRNVNKAKEK